MSQVSACATGAHAIGEAARTISEGAADVMIAGGTEATVSPLGVGGFNAMRALSTRNDAPEKASRPFDVDRDGFVIAEGAGLLVLEERESALRGVPILAELVGYGRSADGYHMTSPCVDGKARSAACEWRFAKPTSTAFHRLTLATSTPTAHRPGKATSPKRSRSRRYLVITPASSRCRRRNPRPDTCLAAGGVEAAFSILALQDGILPPTINLDKPDPECDLDYIPHTARAAQSRAALSNSFGFGGTNASLIFAKHI